MVVLRIERREAGPQLVHEVVGDADRDGRDVAAVKEDDEVLPVCVLVLEEAEGVDVASGIEAVGANADAGLVSRDVQLLGRGAVQ